MADDKDKGKDKVVSTKSSCMPGFAGMAGCGCFILVFLIVAFVLGAMYGKQWLPTLFEKAHESIDTISEQAHEGLYIADEKLEENQLKKDK